MQSVELLKIFQCLESVFESVCDCFKNSKDVYFEIEQVTKSNLPTQKVLDVFFLIL